MPISTQSSSPTAASTPKSTPGSTPGPTAPNRTAYDTAVVKRRPASTNVVGTSLASQTATAGGTPPPGNTSLSAYNSSPPSASASSNFVRNATNRFTRLFKKDLIDFQNVSLLDLRKEMDRIQREQEVRRELVNMGRIQRFVEGMEQIGKVLDVFVNVHNVVAFVWGPMKFLLLVGPDPPF